MVKTRPRRTINEKGVRSLNLLSSKKKKSPRSEENPSPNLPIVNVPFQEKDSGVPAQANVQAGGTT